MNEESINIFVGCTPAQLAKLFVDCRETADRMELLKAQIAAAVLPLGDTQKIAGVTATFYHESREVDNEQAVMDSSIPQMEEVIASYTTTKTSVRWSEIVKQYALDTSNYVTEVKPARVVVKV